MDRPPHATGLSGVDSVREEGRGRTKSCNGTLDPEVVAPLSQQNEVYLLPPPSHRWGN